MCDDCIRLAEDVIDAMSGLAFWRDLTEFERAFGDIPRMAGDFDRVEVETAERLTPVVAQMIDQLVAEAVALVRSDDFNGISKLTASYEGPLAKAIRESASAGVEAGKKQIHDQFRAQLGESFSSLPPRKRPKLTREYLNAKAEVQAKEIAEAVTAGVRKIAVVRAARRYAEIPLDDEEALVAEARAVASKAVEATAVSVAREAIAVGRFIAIEDTAAYIDRLVYTAILDNAVCPNCSIMDGVELPIDQADAAPNPNCIGEAHGNSCRCSVIVQFTRDANNRIGVRE